MRSSASPRRRESSRSPPSSGCSRSSALPIAGDSNCRRGQDSGSASFSREGSVRAVLIDAGPLVALLDRSDGHHAEIVEAIKAVQDPLVSVWPVVVEAMYLLSFSWKAQKALWEILETGTVQLLPLGQGDVPPMKGLMEKYHDLPMTWPTPLSSGLRSARASAAC